MIGRREFLASAALAAGASAQAPSRRQTQFQIACMTLPYGAFPLERALTGIRTAGFKYVAWGVSHRDSSGKSRPLIAVEAPPAEAAKIGARCRNEGLTPVMMFATVHFEEPAALDAHRRRVDQAQAAKIPYLLTFGGTKPGQYESVIKTLKGAAEHAKSAGVTIVIKQHGGNTGTGKDCSRIIADVGHEAVRMCYDAGNVLDYESHDPLADIKTCWQDIRAFALKDHRDTPKDEDCAPGFGEIDHYKLMAPVMHTGLTMPLAFENIFEPLVPRPTTPEGVDRLAKRSREFIEAVLTGLAQHTSASA